MDPQPPVVTERVAVGLLDSRARRSSDVAEEQRRVDVARDLSQVAVVPGRLDASENGGSLAIRVIPPTPKPSPFVVSTPRRAWRLWSMRECSGL